MRRARKLLPGAVAGAAGLVAGVFAWLAAATPAMAEAVPPDAATWPRLVVEEEPGSGVVYFRVMILAGSVDDPVGEEGLAYFTTSLLRRGAGGHSRGAMETALDEMGAGLEVRVDKELTLVVGRCLRTQLLQFYPLLRDVLLEPDFPAGEVEGARRDQVDALQQLKNANEQLGIEAFYNFLFAGTSWGHSAVGRLSAIRKLNRVAARRFYERHFRRDRLLIGLGGDFSGIVLPPQGRKGVALPLVDRMRADFVVLPVSEAARAEAPLPTLKGRRALIVEKPGLEQGQINIGWPLVLTRGHPDYPPMAVVQRHFGSHRDFTGVLMRRVRSERGLTYGAYAYIEYFPYPYAYGADTLPWMNVARTREAWRMWSFTLAKNMEFTAKLMMYEFHKLLAAGIPPGRFAEIRRFTRDRFVFEVETGERRLSLRLDDLRFGGEGGGGGFAAEFPRRLEALTLAQVTSAIRTHLARPELALVVTVPNAEEFRRQLLTPEATVEYESGIDAGPIREEDGRVARQELAIAAEDILTVSADQLFE
jgi:zinc protease